MRTKTVFKHLWCLLFAFKSLDPNAAALNFNRQFKMYYFAYMYVSIETKWPGKLLKRNQSKHYSSGGGKRSGHGGAHDGGPALHPTPIRTEFSNVQISSTWKRWCWAEWYFVSVTYVCLVKTIYAHIKRGKNAYILYESLAVLLL